VKAKISQLLDRAEKPEETLYHAYERQLEDLQNVKLGIAGVVTAKKRLQMQEAELNQRAEKLDAQAREAMTAVREDLARAALERKQLFVQNPARSTSRWPSSSQSTSSSPRPRNSCRQRSRSSAPRRK
jgi:phage shock protein A